MILSDFPQEIIENIADFLCFRDKISCSLVCKSWKRVFQDTIYSDIIIRSDEALQDVMTPSQKSRRKYHEIGHLVRYLTIDHWDITVEKIYALQKTFPNIKYLYFVVTYLDLKFFGSIADWNLWGSLTELRMDINGLFRPAIENSLVEIIVCLPLLRRLTIQSRMQYSIIIAFSVNNFETIHSNLRHLEYMKLSTGFLNLSDTDLERIPNVSPATTMKILDIIPSDADYRWLCYFSRKYPNLHTIDLGVKYLLPDIEVQRHNTMTLFQQVPVSFQHLERFDLKYSQNIEREKLLFVDKIHFHDAPLKHVSIDVSVRNGSSSDYLCDASRIIAETCLEKCSNTIESFHLKCNSKHATPINLTGMENSLCNLVKLDINIPTVADIDTFLRAAPRLKYLQLKYSDIKVKKELYNSERFELQSFVLYISTITSDVIRFLSFHCRKLDTLSLVDTSVYGSFTRPGCQLIDMTYSRLQSLSLENTSFFIKDNKKCPENRNTTLITRPVDDIPPRQNYKFDVLPNFIGATPTEANHRSFRAHKFCGMICISKTRVSHSEKFFSDFEEFKKKAIERAAGSTKVNSYMKLNNSCAFGYTKIDLGYVVDCEIHLD